MSAFKPPRIVTPGPGEESVWDFPRPPRIDPVRQRVRVEFGGRLVADSTAALRVCETASPPTFYIPPADVALDCLEATARTSFCEWKGRARYWTLVVDGRRAEDAAWGYPSPSPGFEVLKDHVAFYASRVDACWVGDDCVTPQPGRFYGGWITPGLVGPFKGEPGSEGW